LTRNSLTPCNARMVVSSGMFSKTTGAPLPMKVGARWFHTDYFAFMMASMSALLNWLLN
jgi:hypothetical protein